MRITAKKGHFSAEQKTKFVVIKCKKKKRKSLGWKKPVLILYFTLFFLTFSFLSQKMTFGFCYSYKELKNNTSDALFGCTGMSLETEEDGC